MPKVNQHSLDRHARSARWFARNRLGGRGILYHRHVGSVLARDWSRRMDLFIGTVDASAKATTFLGPGTPAATTNDNSELVIADYVRPTPAESAYLDTAVNPVPWPNAT